MRKRTMNMALLAFTALIMVLSIWGPEVLARYRDKTILNEIHTQEAEAEGAGYRYAMNRNEKLYILSKGLNSQTLPESEQNARTRDGIGGADYEELAGGYAFIVNHRGPSDKELTEQELYETCNRELAVLKSLEILPDGVGKVESAYYDAVLYSAIDVLEPRNNVAVWKVNLSNNQKNADKSNRLMDVYIDADDGKIYEFYARTELEWNQIDPDEIIGRWSEYMGLSAPMPYEVENPLLETTPYFKKYVFSGIGEENTVATVGFYEGINELFLKISK